MSKFTLVLTLVNLTLVSQAQASLKRVVSYSQIRGTCYLAMTSNGIVTHRDQLILAQVDPWKHFGLTLLGNIQSYQVQVTLNVSNYDQIGSVKSGEVRLVISKEQVSANTAMSGMTFAQGDMLRGGLQTKDANLDCVIGLQKSGHSIAISRWSKNKNDLNQIKDIL